MWFTALLYKWANRAQAKGDKPGRGSELSGFVGGTTTESTSNRTFTVCAKQTSFDSPAGIAIAPPAVPENQCIIRECGTMNARFIRPRINEKISRIQGY